MIVMAPAWTMVRGAQQPHAARAAQTLLAVQAQAQTQLNDIPGAGQTQIPAQAHKMVEVSPWVIRRRKAKA